MDGALRRRTHLHLKYTSADGTQTLVLQIVMYDPDRIYVYYINKYTSYDMCCTYYVNCIQLEIESECSRNVFQWISIQHFTL